MNRLRSPESYPAIFLTFLLLLGLLTGTWAVTRSAALTAAATARTASASPTLPADATPVGALAPDALRVFAVGAIPGDHRFMLLGEGGDERLLLLDLAQGNIRLVAHFEGKGEAVDQRITEVTATPDGTTVVILLRSDADNSRIFVIRPITGAVFSFTVPSASMPRVTPDGRSVVVAHADSRPSRHGVWRFDTATGTGTRWLEDDPTRSPPHPIGWSSDGRRLAVLLDPDGAERRVAVAAEGVVGLRILGAGSGARWRGDDVLVWDSRVPGGGVLAYGAGTAAAAFPPQRAITIDRAEPRPRSTDIATLERVSGSQEIVLHGTGRAPVSYAIPQPGAIIAFWWSFDGARLYAWTQDVVTTTVTELLTNTPVVQICLRRTVAPPCS